MGNFITSSQIFNGEGLDKQQFIDKFCKAMADSGYVVCDSDEGEKSYILRFDADSKWVAIASEEYAQNSNAAKSDTGRIAKMLGTYCMNTEVIDSDCAAMSLYGKDGKSADMLLMGRYDDYFGDDNPEPNEKIWSQFLSGGSTWEQFNEILGGEYVFVEDGLAQLAPVIGMYSGNFLFSAEDVNEKDNSTIILDFTKVRPAIVMSRAGKVTKSPKHLTLNTAFKQVFGEALEPLGFKIVKGRYPHYVRIIKDEIVHVITVQNDAISGTFSILGGIATIYRKEMDFSKNPKLEAGHWLKHLGWYYRNVFPSDYNRINEIAMNSFKLPDINDSEDVKKCLCEALEKTMTWLIPELDKVVDVDSAIMFLFRFSPRCLKLYNETDKFYDNIYYNESYLFTKAQNTDFLIDEYRKKLIFSNEFEKKYFGTEPDILPEGITNNIKQKLQSFLISEKNNLNTQRNALHNLQILKNID